ncbi:MAG: hypothetical protein A2622_04755 [Bdellovibrionales bacterium RIFCSPHIGHO2_01_FULL_40_29]|nr:MAG: hypothetical protein A2622_04755 [Bdellovibrionales bacterium RIFCSPHIGHO2_01_FULL_40_29]OFZ34756.1 MAG: hypothetical protein A3D17_10615 [Bdellovibrionales bacterium RIFCSPHIGHO2_02_FULL_40_15]
MTLRSLNCARQSSSQISFENPKGKFFESLVYENFCFKMLRSKQIPEEKSNFAVTRVIKKE